MLSFRILFLAIFTKFTSQELVWEQIVPAQNSILPKARQNAAIGYHAKENTIYIFGGMLKENEQPLNDVYKFDLDQKVWQSVSRNPSKIDARYSTVFGSRGDYMYVATGEGIDSSSKERTFFDDIWRFNFVSESWDAELSSEWKPKNRYSAAGGIHEDDSTFLITHGYGDDELFSDTFSYNTESSASTRGWDEESSGSNNYNPKYPHGRFEHSCAMVSKNILVLFGGCLSGQGTGGPCPSDDSWTFDKFTNEWSELNRCSAPKTSSAMARLPKQNSTKERLVLWGGNSESRTTLVSDSDEEDEVSVFDPDKKEWMMKKVKAKDNKFPEPREGHVVVTTKSGIVMFGGKRLSDDEFLADIWLLRGSSDDADLSADGRDCGRQYFNLIMLHGIFMFIGWSVFMIMGIFAARYFRFLQPLWYRMHMIFQILAVVFVLAGTICGIVSVPSHQHFKFAHSIFGYLLFVMVIQQPFNAMLRPQPTEQGFNCGRAFWELWHKWSGRLILLAGIINVTLGLFLAVAPTVVWSLWLGYLGLWVVIFIVAELIKRPFEKDLRRRSKKPVVYDTSNPYRISKGQVNTAF